MQTQYTARYLEYCWPLTPDQRKAQDGNMANFMIWIQRRWREFWQTKPWGTMRAATAGVQDEFDAWLTANRGKFA